MNIPYRELQNELELLERIERLEDTVVIRLNGTILPSVYKALSKLQHLRELHLLSDTGRPSVTYFCKIEMWDLLKSVRSRP